MAEQAEMNLDTGEGDEPVTEPAAEDSGKQKDGEPSGEPAQEEASEKSWRDLIKDEKLREYAERHNTLDDLVKGHSELRKKVSKAIVPPGKDASEEEVAEFRKALGVPEKVEDYRLDEYIPELKEAPPDQKEVLNGWLDKFHEANIPPASAGKLMQFYQEQMNAQLAAQQKADEEFVRESEGKLKDDWGKDYDVNRRYAARAAEQLFGEDFEMLKSMETRDGRLLLDNPVMLRGLASIGREMGEGRLGSVLDDEAKMTIQEQANEFRRKRDEAMAKGDTKAARTYDQKEREVLGKLTGTSPVVGTSGRTV